MAEPRTLPDDLHDELDAAARRDPNIRHTLELIAGYRKPSGQGMQPAARRLNAARGAELREAFIAAAYTSRQVAELLGVADHRAVAARRARHTLLGWTIGNETYHPSWQFTDSGPVPGLRSVIKALTATASSPLAADRLMRRRRDDLDGRSLADLLAEGNSDLVVRLIAAVNA